MTRPPDPRRRTRRDIPEVVQTSAMDCGPAALAALLQGHRIAASYGRLREVCQTSVDGTSLDTLEVVARRLGLDARQVLLPPEAVFDPVAGALPGLVVLRREDGGAHFVAAWRRRGGAFGDVQVMDPGTGRAWRAARGVERQLLVHPMELPARQWLAWMTGATGLGLLGAWLDEARVPAEVQERLGGVAFGGRARGDGAPGEVGWEGPAALFATARMLRRLVGDGGLSGGTGALAERLYEAAVAEVVEGAPTTVPLEHWMALPCATPGHVVVRATPLLVVRGATAAEEAETDLPSDLGAVIEAAPPRPWRTVWAVARAADPGAAARLALALPLVGVGAALEALLWRGLVDGASLVPSVTGRVGLLGAAAGLALGIGLVRVGMDAQLLRLGRQVEMRLRARLLETLPRLPMRYYLSRPASDLAERAHGLHALRGAPDGVVVLARLSVDLVVSAVVLGALAPWSLPVLVALGLSAVVLPRALAPRLAEAAMRKATLHGALARLGLDALLGGLAVRTHGAAPAVLGAHERLLVAHAEAGRSVRDGQLVGSLVAACVSIAGAGLLLAIGVSADAASLLYVFFALRLPVLVQGLVNGALALPALAARLERLLEPLGTPREEVPENEGAAPLGAPVSLTFTDVEVEAAGRRLLAAPALAVAAGEHIAVVGRSGAGKSTLLGLLLGWHRPSRGEVRVDGAPLDPARLRALRLGTAWVDPAVQLWSRSVLDNLRYGSDAAIEGAGDDADVLRRARLREVVARLPDGLQTTLGEGGAGLSGGEGQRVRLGRALRRSAPALVLLDEPFRGLDHTMRRELLAGARELWRATTLLCVTHDVAETTTFPRVLVVEDGQIVEDGPPEVLRAAGGRYADLLAAEVEVRRALWGADDWRRLTMRDGRLGADTPRAPDPEP